MRITQHSLTILVISTFIISLSFVSAEGCDASGFMGRFQQDTNITITETCPSCAFINITIKDPKSNKIIINQPMTLENGTFTYIINDTLTNDLGTYYVEGFSNLTLPFKACYIVTNIKREITIQESVIYVLLAAFAFLAFLLNLWGAIALPFKNPRNEGRIVAVSALKYFKVGCMFLAFAFLVWLSNLVFTLSNNLVTLSQYNGFFQGIFQILIAFVWPVFVLMIIVFVVMGWKDLKLNKLLLRGFTPAG